MQEDSEENKAKQLRGIISGITFFLEVVRKKGATEELNALGKHRRSRQDKPSGKFPLKPNSQQACSQNKQRGGEGGGTAETGITDQPDKVHFV